MKSIGVLMANTFVDKRKKYGKEDGGSVNPIRPCVDEYQFSPTSLETTFFQPGCSQRKAKRGIINNLPRPQNFPHPMGPPATSFVLLTNPVAVFLIHCLSQKRSFCPNMQSRVRTDAWHGKEQLELLQNAVGFSLWSVFQFSQNALFHFLWHCRHLRNSLRTSVDFGRLKNNSIIRKCSQFRVNLLITFYPDQPQKIVVIPPLIEHRLHYLNVAQSTCVFARSQQPAVFQSGLRGASITDSSERSIKPSIALVLTTPPPLFCIWTIYATSSLYINTLLLLTYWPHYPWTDLNCHACCV